MQQARDSNNEKCHDLVIEMITDSLARNRHNSAGDHNPSTSSPLPDIIPVSRDRSVSLPDVPSLRQQQEQAVGRELRRISDEFHYTFITPPRVSMTFKNNTFITHTGVLV